MAKQPLSCQLISNTSETPIRASYNFSSTLNFAAEYQVMSGIVAFLTQRLNSAISAPLNITGLPSPPCSGAGAGGAGAGGAAAGGTTAGGRV